MTRDSLLGNVAAIAVSVIWGLSFVAARAALSSVTPILLATIRFLVASFIFAPVLARELLCENGMRVNLSDLVKLGALGFLSISVYFWLQYTGIMYAGAGISALLVVGLIPILTGVASVFVLKEEYGIQQILGTGIGFLGIAVITLPGLLLQRIDVMFYVGVLCLFGNAVCWALYSTFSRRTMKRNNKPLVLTAYVTILGTAALIPMSLTSDWSLVSHLNSTQWASVLYLAVMCSCIGYYLWNFSLCRIEAVRAAVWQYLEPLVAFTAEAFVFGTTPSMMTVIGSIAIVAGALLTSVSAPRLSITKFLTKKLKH